mgnify:CR=1 FL=1
MLYKPIQIENLELKRRPVDLQAIFDLFHRDQESSTAATGHR